MTTLASSGRPRSMLRYEWDQFRAQVREIRDWVVNSIFALSFGRAEWRGRTLTLLFFVLVGLVALRAHRLPEWTEHFRNVFIYLLNPVVRPTFATNPITDTLRFALDGWPTLLRYLPIFVLPYLFALHNASRYLADIFEIPVDLARKFIWEVALGGTSEIGVIREGEFKNRDDSLIYAIGGPGYVIVDMDSAALFEKPDGTPHVIGPTVHGPAPLSGFERFRQAIDLREQHIRLDDLEDIAGRSRDGIRVRAADVHIRFSVDRSRKERNLRQPYPFKSDQVIEKLIYEEVREVGQRLEDIPGANSSPSSILSATKLLHAEFRKFIGEHKLTEFLASYGESEASKMDAHKTAIDQRQRTVTPDKGFEAEEIVKEKVPAFTTRPALTELFSRRFTRLYPELELIWMDVGTWKTPVSIVPENHLDAWRLSGENTVKGNKAFIDAQEQRAMLDKIIAMIQNTPIEKYRTVLVTKNREISPRQAVGSVVNGYREQLIEARGFLQDELLKKDADKRGIQNDLDILEEAVNFITRILDNNKYHWVHY